jgi:hypothetical protein
MTMSGPAVLSSALLARKGSAAPTGYTPMRVQDVGTARGANENAGKPQPPPLSLATAGGGMPSLDSERARVSVRLDRERHLKLKLTAAHLQSSLQDIFTDALDRYLEQLGPEVLRNDCACLSLKHGTAPRRWPSD